MAIKFNVMLEVIHLFCMSTTWNTLEVECDANFHLICFFLVFHDELDSRFVWCWKKNENKPEKPLRSKSIKIKIKKI